MAINSLKGRQHIKYVACLRYSTLKLIFLFVCMFFNNQPILAQPRISLGISGGISKSFTQFSGENEAGVVQLIHHQPFGGYGSLLGEYRLSPIFFLETGFIKPLNVQKYTLRADISTSTSSPAKGYTHSSLCNCTQWPVFINARKSAGKKMSIYAGTGISYTRNSKSDFIYQGGGNFNDDHHRIVGMHRNYVTQEDNISILGKLGVHWKGFGHGAFFMETLLGYGFVDQAITEITFRINDEVHYAKIVSRGHFLSISLGYKFPILPEKIKLK